MADDDAPPPCGICFNDIDPIENPRGVINSCQHIFCSFCIEAWGKQTNTCPQCKQRFTRIHTRDANTGAMKEVKVRKREYRGHEAESSDEEEWEAAGGTLLGQAPPPERGLRCVVCNLATDVADMLLCETRTCSATVHPQCRRDGQGTGPWRCAECCEARGLGESFDEPPPVQPSPPAAVPQPPAPSGDNGKGRPSASVASGTARASPSPAQPFRDDSDAWLPVVADPTAPPGRWSSVDTTTLIATQQSKGLAELARRKAARAAPARPPPRPAPQPLAGPPPRKQPQAPPPHSAGAPTAAPLPPLDVVRRDAFEAKFRELRECAERRHDTLMRYGVVRQHGPYAERSMKDAAAAREEDIAAARAEAQTFASKYVERVAAERLAVEQRVAARKAIEQAAALRKLQTLIASKHEAWVNSRGGASNNGPAHAASSVVPPVAAPLAVSGAGPRAPLPPPPLKKKMAPPPPSVKLEPRE